MLQTNKSIAKTIGSLGATVYIMRLWARLAKKTVDMREENRNRSGSVFTQQRM